MTELLDPFNLLLPIGSIVILFNKLLSSYYGVGPFGCNLSFNVGKRALSYLGASALGAGIYG